MQPYVLLWLRYTAFILLYPLGVASELAMVALAMPHIKAHRPLSIQVGGALLTAFDRALQAGADMWVPAALVCRSGLPSVSACGLQAASSHHVSVFTSFASSSHRCTGR